MTITQKYPILYLECSVSNCLVCDNNSCTSCKPSMFLSANLAFCESTAILKLIYQRLLSYLIFVYLKYELYFIETSIIIINTQKKIFFFGTVHCSDCSQGCLDCANSSACLSCRDPNKKLPECRFCDDRFILLNGVCKGNFISGLYI